MKLEEMEKIRKSKDYSYARVAEMVGMEEEKVRNIFKGNVVYLRLEDAFALEVALTEDIPPTKEKVTRIVYEMLKLPEGWEEDDGEDLLNLGCVREEPAYWIETAVRKRQGEYTLEDYYNLPYETMQAVEMIDGVLLYTKTAPPPWHAIALQKIMWLIDMYIEKKRGDCFVFIEPLDVLIKEQVSDSLNINADTVVKPDGFVICNRDKVTNDGIIGVPDLVVEVLSRSTQMIDLKVKKRIYCEAGVREYWIVDLEHEKVIVYRFEEKNGPTIYGFYDAIPVWIYNGDLQIDFREVTAQLERVGYYRWKAENERK